MSVMRAPLGSWRGPDRVALVNARRNRGGADDIDGGELDAAATVGPPARLDDPASGRSLVGCARGE